MFLSVEVEQTHPNLRWMDLGARDTVNDGETTIRVAIDEAPKMLADFLERYMAKCPQSFEAPNSQARQLEDFFEEAVMARAILQKGNVTNDLVVLLPTTYIDFTYSEKVVSANRNRRGSSFFLMMRCTFWINVIFPAVFNASVGFTT